MYCNFNFNDRLTDEDGESVSTFLPSFLPCLGPRLKILETVGAQFSLPPADGGLKT